MKREISKQINIAIHRFDQFEATAIETQDPALLAACEPMSRFFKRLKVIDADCQRIKREMEEAEKNQDKEKVDSLGIDLENSKQMLDMCVDDVQSMRMKLGLE